MHYYQFNIADYRKDTQHLTAVEHYIYRELMDWYYLDEKQIPLDKHTIIRRLRLVETEHHYLDLVLADFFEETDFGWSHGRIEHEIVAYQSMCESNRINGSKGGRPKKPKRTQSVNFVNPNETQINPNQEPITKNHKPIKKKTNGRFAPPSLNEIQNYLDERKIISFSGSKFSDFYQAQGWKLSNGRVMKDWKAAVRTWANRGNGSDHGSIRNQNQAGVR